MGAQTWYSPEQALNWKAELWTFQGLLSLKDLLPRLPLLGAGSVTVSNVFILAPPGVSQDGVAPTPSAAASVKFNDTNRAPTSAGHLGHCLTPQPWPCTSLHCRR